MRGGGIVFHSMTEFQSVHDGHHHVAHNQVGYNLIRQCQTLLSIGSLIDLILILENATQVGSHISIVIDNEYGIIHVRTFVWKWGACNIHLFYRLIISYFAFHLHVKHLVDDFTELMGVALYDGEKSRGLCAGLLYVIGSGQLIEWSLNEGQWRAQLMTYLCIKIELLTFHFISFVDNTSFL